MWDRLQGEIWGEPSLPYVWDGHRFSSLLSHVSCTCMEKALDRRGAWFPPPYPSIAKAGAPK